MSDSTITPRPGDTSNNLLAKILRRLDGIASPGDTNAQLLAKILAQFAGGGGGSSYFNKVGAAYIGGDQTGDARGANSLDVQSARSAASHVGSGNKASVFGYDNSATGDNCSVFGYKNTSTGLDVSVFGYKNVAGQYSIVYGWQNTASGAYFSVAVGSRNNVSGINASAFGYQNAASGLSSTAIGNNCQSTGTVSTAVGANTTATGEAALAIGTTCNATTGNSTALGNNSDATGAASNAIGYFSKSRVAHTSNICGPQIVRKDNGEDLAAAFYSFCGVNTVLSWPEVDLKTVTDYVITLPSGCHFYPDECGVLVTSANTVSVQPTVRFGNSGTPAKFLAAAITTTAAAQFDRHRFQTLLSAAGEVTLSAGVTIAATATTLLGRFYMKGLLVEDE